jgi:glycosyltransferase involved in cell wall biosynthesis
LLRVAVLGLYDFEEVRGGTELFIRHLGKAFPGCEVITFSTSTKEVPNLDLTRLNLEYVRMGVAISKRFARLHKREPFDLVVCNDIAGLGLKLFAPEVPAMQVFHYTYKGFAEGALRGQQGYLPSRYFYPYMEKATAKEKKVVAVSHKTRRELEAYYGLRAHVIENAVSMDSFRPLPKSDCRERLGINWDGPIGIFVGRADVTKGYDIVKALARKRRDIKFLCVTGDDIKDEDLIVAHRVRNEDMPIYYSASDFLLFPSRYESASYTTIEAMACNIPVVAHRTGLFEDIEEREVGRILKEVDEATFSQAITELLSGSKINPRQLAESRFSLDRFISDYKGLAKSMVGLDF